MPVGNGEFRISTQLIITDEIVFPYRNNNNKNIEKCDVFIDSSDNFLYTYYGENSSNGVNNIFGFDDKIFFSTGNYIETASNSIKFFISDEIKLELKREFMQDNSGILIETYGQNILCNNIITEKVLLKTDISLNNLKANDISFNVVINRFTEEKYLEKIDSLNETSKNVEIDTSSCIIESDVSCNTVKSDSVIPIGSIISILCKPGTATNNVKIINDKYLLCNGAPCDKDGNFNELWETIGYNYGGSGSSFNLPNLLGRTLFGTVSKNYNYQTNVKKRGKNNLNHVHKYNIHNHNKNVSYEDPPHNIVNSEENNHKHSHEPVNHKHKITISNFTNIKDQRDDGYNVKNTQKMLDPIKNSNDISGIYFKDSNAWDEANIYNSFDQFVDTNVINYNKLTRALNSGFISTNNSGNQIATSQEIGNVNNNKLFIDEDNDISKKYVLESNWPSVETTLTISASQTSKINTTTNIYNNSSRYNIIIDMGEIRAIKGIIIGGNTNGNWVTNVSVYINLENDNWGNAELVIGNREANINSSDIKEILFDDSTIKEARYIYIRPVTYNGSSYSYRVGGLDAFFTSSTNEFYDTDTFENEYEDKTLEQVINEGTYNLQKLQQLLQETDITRSSSETNSSSGETVNVQGNIFFNRFPNYSEVHKSGMVAASEAHEGGLGAQSYHPEAGWYPNENTADQIHWGHWNPIVHYPAVSGETDGQDTAHHVPIEYQHFYMVATDDGYFWDEQDSLRSHEVDLGVNTTYSQNDGLDVTPAYSTGGNWNTHPTFSEREGGAADTAAMYTEGKHNPYPGNNDTKGINGVSAYSNITPTQHSQILNNGQISINFDLNFDLNLHNTDFLDTTAYRFLTEEKIYEHNNFINATKQINESLKNPDSFIKNEDVSRNVTDISFDKSLEASSINNGEETIQHSHNVNITDGGGKTISKNNSITPSSETKVVPPAMTVSFIIKFKD